MLFDFNNASEQWIFAAAAKYTKHLWPFYWSYSKFFKVGELWYQSEDRQEELTPFIAYYTFRNKLYYVGNVLKFNRKWTRVIFRSIVWIYGYYVGLLRPPRLYSTVIVFP